MTDKSTFAKNLEVLTPDQIDRVKNDLESELARRGQANGPDPSRMTDGEFEKYRHEQFRKAAKNDGR